MNSRVIVKRMLMLVMLVLCAVSLMAAPVAAQAGVPIAIGENKTGEISAAQPSQTFDLLVPAPQIASIQVLGLGAGFAPALRISDPSGVVIRTESNAVGSTAVQTTGVLSTTGVYTLTVSSANGSQGTFVISVQPGPALPPAVPLVAGVPVPGTVDAEQPIVSYSFAASPLGVLAVSVRSDEVSGAPAPSGPIIVLRNTLTSETVASSGAGVIGARYRIPQGANQYVVEVTHSGSPTAEGFVICLEAENTLSTCPGGSVAQGLAPTLSVPTPTPFAPPVIPPGGPCSAASSRGQTVNVRSGPGLNFSVVAQLAPGVVVPVQARVPDGTWFQITLNGSTGWVSSTVVVTGGNCSAITVVTVSAPGTPPTASTITATPTGTVSQTPTASATATATLTPTVSATLNFSLPPNYGSTALTSGFVPDPFQVGVTSGGSVDVSYLGGGCTGFATSAPDFSVNYTSGAFPTLRFYFVGSGDSTMIINGPSGSYSCSDDSFGTLNPSIDFNNPSSGRYDVWIGSFSSGTFVSGTLSVTENTGNHP